MTEPNCAISKSQDQSQKWNSGTDIYTGKDNVKPTLFPPSFEKDYRWQSGKTGGGSSDGYYAISPEGDRYYIKKGGDAASNQSEHAFNEVVTGSIYTSLHNRGLLAGPQQRIIIREKGTDGKAIGAVGMPDADKVVMEDSAEILVGVKFQEGLDPRGGHPDAARINSSSDSKVKRIGKYLKDSKGEGRDDLLEAYFLDCLLGSWDTIGGNVFTILPDTPTDKNGKQRPLKLFKLDFGNGLQFFASGRKKHGTFGPGGPSARDAIVPSQVADIGLKRGFWPRHDDPGAPIHIIDEFPGPHTHPGTMRIALSHSPPPPPKHSIMRGVNLYSLVSDRNIIDYWKARLGSGNILSRYVRRINAIIDNYYVSTNPSDFNSSERGKFLKDVLFHRLQEIYCELPKWLEKHISYTTESGKILQRQYYGGKKKTRRGKKNKKSNRPTLKHRKPRKYKM